MASHHHHRRALLGLGVIAALSTWTSVAAQGLDIEGLRGQVLAVLNQERAARGLPPLRRVQALQDAAQAYSELMMRATAGGPVYLAHIGPDGSTLGARVSATGYNWYSLGETLAAGQKSPEQVIAEWLGSPLHRENLLSGEYRDVGIGIAVGPGTWSDGRLDPQVIWWTADLGAGPGSEGGDIPSPPPIASPPPAITGYTTLAGAPTSAAPFGSLLLVKGQNLGVSGAVSFHGRSTSALIWSPTAVMVWVPLQASYPDVGPVAITVSGLTATGPDFTTTQPAPLTVVPAPVQTPPAQIPPTTAPATPTVSQLTDGRGQRIDTVSQGRLFSVRGQGFGTNASRKGCVLFITSGGTKIAGAIWGWTDGSIDVFAPYTPGRVTVAVQVDGKSGLVTSNKMPLAIQ